MKQNTNNILWLQADTRFGVLLITDRVRRQLFHRFNWIVERNLENVKFCTINLGISRIP